MPPTYACDVVAPCCVGVTRADVGMPPPAHGGMAVVGGKEAPRAPRVRPLRGGRPSLRALSIAVAVWAHWAAGGACGSCVGSGTSPLPLLLALRLNPRGAAGWGCHSIAGDVVYGYVRWTTTRAGVSAFHAPPGSDAYDSNPPLACPLRSPPACPPPKAPAPAAVGEATEDDPCTPVADAWMR